MTRFLLIMASVLTIGAATLSLQSFGAQSVEAASPRGPVNGLLILPDGSTFVAAEGSLAREIAEWLASREGTDAVFSFTAFVEDQPKLTSIGLGQAADVATILRGAPAASIEIAGDEAQAKALAHLLDDRGIAGDRMKVVPAAGLGSVTLRISRGSTAPLITAKS
ncbi:Outer membrane protein OmpA [Sphingopyxis sp. YR583]|uniref:hypothetical protein n=1 Tax=Sphingopyxis sp. YR583 TaxID=1881047 RepID=UPI0008A73EEF|nr:hypothetical protein [Sphingopyxis sp. YR583]SEH13055.1 Outer membrane protein OmpA [Sphingopyxis sp. YR583]